MEYELLKQKVEEGLTISQLSEYFSLSSIRYWLKKFNLKTKHYHKQKKSNCNINHNNIKFLVNKYKDEVVNLNNENNSYEDIAKILGIKYSLVKRIFAKNKLKSKFKLTHSSKTKSLLSQKRKKYLAENPDKHVWKRHEKFKSVPCEKLKEYLHSKNIDFIEEYQPLLDQGRYFSVDVAFPDRKIAIEVNGNQHYNRDGSLKDYYQKRHDLLAENGWQIYNLHYSLVWKTELIDSILRSIKDSYKFNYFDFQGYVENCLQEKIKRKEENLQKQYNNCSCGSKKYHKAKRCQECAKKASQKANYPPNEELKKLLWEKSSLTLAKELGISDVALAKYCKRRNISKPPRGYWAKQAATAA